jgi:hypothetical protein
MMIRAVPGMPWSKPASFKPREQHIRANLTPDERAICELRLKEASLILDKFKVWLEKEYCRVPPKSPMS